MRYVHKNRLPGLSLRDCRNWCLKLLCYMAQTWSQGCESTHYLSPLPSWVLKLSNIFHIMNWFLLLESYCLCLIYSLTNYTVTTIGCVLILSSSYGNFSRCTCLRSFNAQYYWKVHDVFNPHLFCYHLRNSLLGLPPNKSTLNLCYYSWCQAHWVILASG